MPSVVSLRRFRRLLAAWCLVFAGTGLAFAIAPESVGQLMQHAGSLAGLDGKLDVRPGTLWHVLALSLMVAVTGLAWQCWRRPLDPEPWRLLLAAKIASTVGFLALAGAHGSIWLTGAASDGFVAATLLWGHQGLLPAELPGWRRRLQVGNGAAYEVWFGKVDLGPERALWFRYTLLDGVQKEGATWAILFDRGRIRAGRTPWPLDAIAGRGAPLPAVPNDQTARFLGRDVAFQVADARLDNGNALGSAGPIAWDLRLQDRGQRFVHVPLLVRALWTPLADLRVSGTVRVAGEEPIVLDGAPAMIGHLYGRRHAHAWNWSHCNHWDGGEEAVFEGLAAHLRLGGRVWPPAASFQLAMDGHTWRFTSTWRMFAATHTFSPGVWTFRTRSGGATLEGEVRAPDATRIAWIGYTDTDDSRLWCANSKLGCLRLRLRDPGRGIDRTLVATGTAAFEQVDRHPPVAEVIL
jgi:hypothetical protein